MMRRRGGGGGGGGGGAAAGRRGGGAAAAAAGRRRGGGAGAAAAAGRRRRWGWVWCGGKEKPLGVSPAAHKHSAHPALCQCYVRAYGHRYSDFTCGYHCIQLNGGNKIFVVRGVNVVQRSAHGG